MTMTTIPLLVGVRVRSSDSVYMQSEEIIFNFRSFWAEVNRTMLLQKPKSSSADFILET